MKKMWIFAISVVTLLFAQLVFAQTAPVDPTQDFLQFLSQSIGGLKGAGTLVIVAFAVQILLKLLNLPFVEKFLGSSFKDWDNKIKMCVIALLTLAGGVISLMLTDHLTLGAALIHSTTMTAYSVFFNQVYKNFIAPAPKPPITIILGQADAPAVPVGTPPTS